MSSHKWALIDAPSQAGRVAVVTGANSGIGLETARGLAQLGARVVMACRSEQSAGQARSDLLVAAPGAVIDIVVLDVASLESVRSAAERIIALTGQIDILVANAGLIATEYSLTVDGFEMDFGTNFLGHFAFIGRLVDHVAPGGRIVTVGSVAHRRGLLDFDDIPMRRGFSVPAAYSRSKLAQMIFATELDRRLSACGRPVTSVIAHPGASRTGVMRGHNRFLQWGFHSPKTRWLVRQFAQEPADGALPTLRAATDPAVRGGQYYGPSGRMQFTGDPVLVRAKPEVYDRVLGARLWALAQDLTGVTYL